MVATLFKTKSSEASSTAEDPIALFQMREWLGEHEYESVEQIKGIMSQKNCPDPTAFERAQYTRALSTYPKGA
jgi:hypothetical protein